MQLLCPMRALMQLWMHWSLLALVLQVKEAWLSIQLSLLVAQGLGMISLKPMISPTPVFDSLCYILSM